MDELEKIYMADDAISGADVYRPITDKTLKPAAGWAADRLNQPFKGPLLDVKPTGFTMDNDGYPGVESWREMFPEKPRIPADEGICRALNPAFGEGGKTGAYRDIPGAFGAAAEPCLNDLRRENVKREVNRAAGNVADWTNQGGAALESSMNPVESRNWQEMPSLRQDAGMPDQGMSRNYGVPRNQEFSIGDVYRPALAKDLSAHLLDPAYGQAGQDASAEFYNRYVVSGTGVNGRELWNRLKNDFGVEEAGKIIGRLGYFSGVRGNPTFSGNEFFRFTPNEAERAMERMERENRENGGDTGYSV